LHTEPRAARLYNDFRRGPVNVAVITLMPLLNSKFDFEAISQRLQQVITDVAEGITTPEMAHATLAKFLADTFVFDADPVGWHVSEISNRIGYRLDLDPAHKEFFGSETPIHQLDHGEPRCTRSRISVDRLKKDLILGSACSALEHMGRTNEIKLAAERIHRCCPQLTPSDAPFLDDPPCDCRNCKISAA